MEDHSIFMDKLIVPNIDELKDKTGPLYPLWNELKDYIYSKYPEGREEWNFPGKKYGWSFRIKDKKRAIMYFLPREGYFKVAFVFGQKAYDVILKSDIHQSIKDDLINAKKYAEGRGVKIEIMSPDIIPDIRFLIGIKLKF